MAETPQDQHSTFDKMFDPSYTGLDPARPEAIQLDERQRAIFAPFVEELPALTDEDFGKIYDRLFDYSWKGNQTSEAAAVRGHPTFNRVPTEESIKTAERRVINLRDFYIRDIVYSLRPDVRSAADTVTALRTDAQVREAVAGYFLGKVRTLPNLPDRVLRNDQKTPRTPGYFKGSIFGQEYAALLALAMIDGSYKPPGEGDAMEYGSGGEAKLGQHRHTAELLLS